jgi:hypothetical protein
MSEFLESSQSWYYQVFLLLFQSTLQRFTSRILSTILCFERKFRFSFIERLFEWLLEISFTSSQSHLHSLLIKFRNEANILFKDTCGNFPVILTLKRIKLYHLFYSMIIINDIKFALTRSSAKTQYLIISYQSSDSQAMLQVFIWYFKLQLECSIIAVPFVVGW